MLFRCTFPDLNWNSPASSRTSRVIEESPAIGAPHTVEIKQTNRGGVAHHLRPAFRALDTGALWQGQRSPACFEGVCSSTAGQSGRNTRILRRLFRELPQEGDRCSSKRRRQTGRTRRYVAECVDREELERRSCCRSPSDMNTFDLLQFPLRGATAAAAAAFIQEQM